MVFFYTKHNKQWKELVYFASHVSNTGALDKNEERQMYIMTHGPTF